MEILFSIICFPGDIVYFIVDFFPDFFVWFMYLCYFLVCIYGFYTKSWEIAVPTLVVLIGYGKSLYIDKVLDGKISPDSLFFKYSESYLLWIAFIAILIYFIVSDQSKSDDENSYHESSSFSPSESRAFDRAEHIKKVRRELRR